MNCCSQLSFIRNAGYQSFEEILIFIYNSFIYLFIFIIFRSYLSYLLIYRVTFISIFRLFIGLDIGMS